MKCDIILAGVGGQGVLSIGAIIASSALKKGLHVKQAEVHGMAMRGGAVQASLRLSDEPIASDLIPSGKAHMILSMEPMEGLRYLDYLSPEGTLVTSTEPVVNIPDYPELEKVLKTARALPNSILLESERLARKAGSARASNMVMVGAATHLLPIEADILEQFIRDVFERKGEKVVETNLKAFRAGIEAARK